MSIIEEFNEMDIDLKNNILCLALVYPFWHLIVIKFSSNFSNNPVHYELPFLLSFCLTMTSFMLYLINTVFWEHAIKRSSDHIDKSRQVLLATYSVFHNIFVISIVSLLAYLKGWSFLAIVSITYIWAVCCAITAIIAYIIRLVKYGPNTDDGKLSP
ncbi:MAG TPA: hypothetical protein VK154_09650 [Chitinophagales bacterium]|nr:hypothetical protein [Chitinophagales bacterium]